MDIAKLIQIDIVNGQLRCNKKYCKAKSYYLRFILTYSNSVIFILFPFYYSLDTTNELAASPNGQMKLFESKTQHFII